MPWNHVAWSRGPRRGRLFRKPHYTFSERNWNVNRYQRRALCPPHLQVRFWQAGWHLTKQKVAKSCFALLELKVGPLFYGNVAILNIWMHSVGRQIGHWPQAVSVPVKNSKRDKAQFRVVSHFNVNVCKVWPGVRWIRSAHFTFYNYTQLLKIQGQLLCTVKPARCRRNFYWFT